MQSIKPQQQEWAVKSIPNRFNYVLYSGRVKVAGKSLRKSFGTGGG